MTHTNRETREGLLHLLAPDDFGRLFPTVIRWFAVSNQHQPRSVVLDPQLAKLVFSISNGLNRELNGFAHWRADVRGQDRRREVLRLQEILVEANAITTESDDADFNAPRRKGIRFHLRLECRKPLVERIDGLALHRSGGVEHQ